MKTRMFAWGIFLCCLIALPGCGDESGSMAGWYLEAENGSVFLVMDDAQPVRLIDKDSMIPGELASGDRIEITCGPVAECDPLETVVLSCRLQEAGDPEEIPQETLMHLELLGYRFAGSELDDP